jgi:hypothetical protein
MGAAYQGLRQNQYSARNIMALQTGFPDPSLDSIEVYPQKVTKKGGGLLYFPPS